MKKERSANPQFTDQLLSLVRSSLWQELADETIFSKNAVDWQEIARIALQQTVGPLVFEGALSLPSEILPPKDWRQRALTFTERNRRTHQLLDSCVAESVSSLDKEGIKSVLLKGQAYARAYPKPEMRQCGDIDLYVGDEHYLTAYSAIKKFGWKRDEEFQPKAKHYGCWLHGILIELHRIAGKLPIGSADFKFQKWSKIQLNESHAYLIIGGENVMVPPPMFDIVFVFMHLYLHFLNGGIGLRHICDWTMLMHSHAKEIDYGNLEQLLKEFRLLRAWKVFAPIAVEHLGLPSEECPFYTSKYSKKAERILSYIMKDGNFGRASKKRTFRPNGYLAGKKYSFTRNSARMFSKFCIDPYIISRNYCSYLIKGITHVVKDIMKKRN